MSKSLVFHLTVIYYWFLLVFVDYSTNYDNSGFKYYILVIPIMLFILYNVGGLFKRKISKEVLWLVLFLLSASVFAIIKLDIRAILSLMVWGLPIVIILKSGLHINLRVVNVLFILTIIAGIITYHIGVNDFGYIPGQTSRNLHQGLWWRVSIFPYSTPPVTGIFALMVLLLNFFHNKSLKSKRIFIVLSIYFLLLSASRTALLVLLVIVTTLLIKRVNKIKGMLLKKTISVLPVLLLLSFFIFPQILLMFDIDNGIINSLVFRSTDSLSSIDELEQTMNRQGIWNSYINHFLSSPIIGVDSNIVATVGHSETMFFSFLANHGIAIIFLILFMYTLVKHSFINDYYLRYSISMVFILFMLTYSSYFQPYNFTFLLLLGLFNIEKRT